MIWTDKNKTKQIDNSRFIQVVFKEFQLFLNKTLDLLF